MSIYDQDACLVLTGIYFRVKTYIPLTNRVRGLYRKLRTEFFPPRFMAQAREKYVKSNFQQLHETKINWYQLGKLKETKTEQNKSKT